MSSSLQSLQKKLKYRFKSQSLLQHALTHRSMPGDNNERLEFLGDAVLNLVLADLLYDYYPKASEGALTRMRSFLAKGESLVFLAQHLQLGSVLLLGARERSGNGALKFSSLENAFEAVLGAVYLDGGFEAVKNTIANLYTGYFSKLTSGKIQLVDPKSRLQEFLQARALPIPEYFLLQVIGIPPEESFRSACYLSHLDWRTEGVGRTRRGSEQSAATNALLYLGVD